MRNPNRRSQTSTASLAQLAPNFYAKKSDDCAFVVSGLNVRVTFLTAAIAGAMFTFEDEAVALNNTLAPSATYFIYGCIDGYLVASLNATAPDDYAPNECRKLGGFKTSAALAISDLWDVSVAPVTASAVVSTNNAVGHSAQRSLTTGSGNNAVGYQAQYSLTTGIHNNAVGHAAQYSLTTGSGNNAVGYQAQYSLTTGSANSAVGYVAQYSLTTGNNNNAAGYAAQRSLTTGSGNDAVGYAAQYLLTTGSGNNAVGYQAQRDITTGLNNTAIGYNTSRGITTGSNNTILGGNVTGLPANLSKNIILAAGDGSKIPLFADNAAALAGGLVAGALYCTLSGTDRIVKVVF